MLLNFHVNCFCHCVRHKNMFLLCYRLYYFHNYLFPLLSTHTFLDAFSLFTSKEKRKMEKFFLYLKNCFFKNMFTLNSLEIYIYEMRVSMSPVFILQYFLMHSHISIDTRKVPFIYFLHSGFDSLCIRKKCFSDLYLKSEYCLRF